MNIGNIINLRELNNNKFIISKIVEGGFGTIYFLRSCNFSFPQVAMKLFKEEIDFYEAKREAVLWSNLSYHKNIAQYFAFGIYENKFYILSKRYDFTLEKYFYENINDEILMEIIRGIILGLDFAFTKLSLIHRDIKPSNICLDDGIVKIGDFGLSSYMKEKITLINNFSEIKFEAILTQKDYGGTFPYMAPEIIKNENPFSISTDIYALGITLFNLVTGGFFPYELPIFINNHKSYCMFNASNINEKLKKMILKCLEKDFIKRYKDYKEIMNDLGIHDNLSISDEEEVFADINLIQTLRKTNLNEKAKTEIMNSIKKYKDHHLFINQLALINLDDKNIEIFEKLIINILLKDKKYNIKFYLEPLFNLASFYFENSNLRKMLSYLNSQSHILSLNSDDFLYEYFFEYCIFKLFDDEKYLAFTNLKNILKMGKYQLKYQ